MGFAEGMRSFAVIVCKKEKNELMFNKSFFLLLTNDKDINILENNDKELMARKIINVPATMMKPYCLSIPIMGLALLCKRHLRVFFSFTTSFRRI